MSVWDISFQKKAIDAMQDPRWVSLIANVCRKLNAGEYDQWFVDCLTQQWSGNKPGYDIYDAYAFALFWADIIHGDIAYAVIDVSEPPKGNRTRRPIMPFSPHYPRRFVPHSRAAQATTTVNCTGMSQ